MQFVQSKEYVYETSSFVRFMATNDDLSTNTGAKLDLYSVSYSNQDNENGIFKLSARKKDGNYIDLIGDGNGLLTWDGKLISTGGIDLSGYVLKNSPEVSNTIIINGNNEGSAISRNNGTELYLSKWDDLDNPGGFILKCPKNKDCSDYVELVGSSGGILMWNEEKVLTEGDLTSNDVTGEIKWFSGSTVPSGYLTCNGAKVSRTTYASLFAIIGTKWGPGDGSTTFTLPNLIGKVAWGATSAGTYMSAGLPSLPSHHHDIGFGHYQVGHYGEKDIGVSHPMSGYGSADWNTKSTLTNSVTLSNSIYGASTTVQPPAVTLIPIIKY